MAFWNLHLGKMLLIMLPKTFDDIVLFYITFFNIFTIKRAFCGFSLIDFDWEKLEDGG